MGLYWLFSRHFELDGHACLDDPLTDVEAVQELMRAYRKMSVAEQVRAVQRLLMEKGYDVGPIDEVLGEPTRRAIRQFQARWGDPRTGQISSVLLYLQLLCSASWGATSGLQYHAIPDPADTNTETWVFKHNATQLTTIARPEDLKDQGGYASTYTFTMTKDALPGEYQAMVTVSNRVMATTMATQFRVQN